MSDNQPISRERGSIRDEPRITAGARGVVKTNRTAVLASPIPILWTLFSLKVRSSGSNPIHFPLNLVASGVPANHRPGGSVGERWVVIVSAVALAMHVRDFSGQSFWKSTEVRCVYLFGCWVINNPHPIWARSPFSRHCQEEDYIHATSPEYERAFECLSRLRSWTKKVWIHLSHFAMIFVLPQKRRILLRHHCLFGTKVLYKILTMWLGQWN